MKTKTQERSRRGIAAENVSNELVTPYAGDWNMKRMMKVSYRCGAVAVVVGIAAMIAAMMFVPVASAAVDAAGVKAVGDKEAEYVLSAMERLKGKAILFPEVFCMQGLLRYAEATGGKKIVERVGSLDKAAYMDSGSLNRLNGGWLESQVTAIVPLELYRATGDKTYLKDCWRVLEEQRHLINEDGTYRYLRGLATDVYDIGALQAVGYRVYGQTSGLDFAVANLSGKESGNRKVSSQPMEKISDWDGVGNVRMVALAQMLEVIPAGYAKRSVVEAIYQSVAGTTKFTVGEVVPGNKTTGRKRTAQDEAAGLEDAYAVAVGIRNGWLKDVKARQDVETYWRKFAENYKPKEQQYYNVVQRPLITGGGILLFASAMIELDKPPVVMDKALAAVPVFRTAFHTTEVDKTLRVWEQMTLDSAATPIPFDADSILSVLVELKRYRLTGDYVNERDCLWALHQLMTVAGEDPALAALVLAEGFKAYGQVRFAEAAKKYLAASKGQNAKIEGLATTLLEPEKTPAWLDLHLGKEAARLYELGMTIGNDAKKAEQAVTEMKALCLSLQDVTGYFHSKDGQKGLCDATSSGQAIIGVAVLLKALPQEHPHWAFFHRVFVNTAYALERDQDGDGLWHVLPRDWNSPQDLTGSAFFVAALATGLEQKWIHRLEYRAMVDNGWKSLQKRGTSENLDKTARNQAEQAVKSYHASPVPVAKEDPASVLGAMRDIYAVRYVRKLPDGREVRHLPTLFAIVDFAGAHKREKIDELLAMNAYPEFAIKRAYPAGGVSFWVAENPSIHGVTDDLGGVAFSMPYVPLPANKPITIMMAIPGQKPCAYKGTGSGIGMKVWLETLKTQPENVDLTGLPEGPSDRVDGKLLAEALLKYHRTERRDLLAMIGKPVTTIPLGEGRLLHPVYLRGKVVSEDGKTVPEASVWLSRNPFMMSRSDTRGEFEILMKEAPLYEPVADGLMITAPGYVAKKVPLASYLDAGIVIQLQRMNYEPVVRLNGSLPMVRVPSGFFRMGKGFVGYMRLNLPHSDGTCVSPWPIQTVNMPSFYFSQYAITEPLHTEIYLWALQNGYKSETTGGFSYPMFANALSERDGYTPCYYTADLRIIRDEKDVTENMVCNLRADGYRLATYAEWVYATFAGRTTLHPWGDDGGGWTSHAIEITANPESIHAWGDLSPARRKPFAWGVYDNYTSILSCPEAINNGVDWRVDESFEPRGPNLRELRLHDRFWHGGRTFSLLFNFTLIDSVFTELYDKWPVPGAFPYGNWALFSGGIGYQTEASIYIPPGGVYTRRFVRSAENICTDVRKMRSEKDPILALPKPVDLETVSKTISMVDIPATTFTMGSRTSGSGSEVLRETEARSPQKMISSRPEHEVTISAFRMSRYEITVEQWQHVRAWAVSKGYTDLPEGQLGKSSSKDMRHPVVNVSWHDVVKWCNAASEKEDKSPCYQNAAGAVFRSGTCEYPVWKRGANGYRLPTEAEWEWAALKDTDAPFYWGESLGLPYAWQGVARGSNVSYPGNSGGQSHPVGQRIGNPFGLYDIYGNVWEWCWDLAAPYPMTIEQKQDPQGPATFEEVAAYRTQIATMTKGKDPYSDLKGLSDLTPEERLAWENSGGNFIGRVVRGGAFTKGFLDNEHIEGRARYNAKPEERLEDIGFRVVASGK